MKFLRLLPAPCHRGGLSSWWMLAFSCLSPHSLEQARNKRQCQTEPPFPSLLVSCKKNPTKFFSLP